MEQGICGISTSIKPFSFQKAVNTTFTILYHKEAFASICGINEEVLKTLVEHLNEAYKRGFEACSVPLMTEAMNNKNNVITLCHDIAMRLSSGQPVTPHCDLHDRLNEVLV